MRTINSVKKKIKNNRKLSAAVILTNIRLWFLFLSVSFFPNSSPTETSISHTLLGKQEERLGNNGSSWWMVCWISLLAHLRKKKRYTVAHVRAAAGCQLLDISRPIQTFHQCGGCGKKRQRKRVRARREMRNKNTHQQHKKKRESKEEELCCVRNEKEVRTVEFPRRGRNRINVWRHRRAQARNDKYFHIYISILSLADLPIYRIHVLAFHVEEDQRVSCIRLRIVFTCCVYAHLLLFFCLLFNNLRTFCILGWRATCYRKALRQYSVLPQRCCFFLFRLSILKSRLCI